MSEILLPDKLYHYCSLKTAIEYILPDKRLLLNPIGSTNDPRENKSFSFAGRNLSSEFTKLHELNSDVSDEIRKGCKLSCFSTDRKNIFGYEYSRMWSLYGENHKGVCIELNRIKFVEENSNKINPDLFKRITYEEFNARQPIKHKTVDYLEVEKLGLPNYVRDVFRPENVDYLFFTKNKEWESENEIRLIYFSDNPDQEYCTINNSINRVILGVDFNTSYYPSIANKLDGVQIDRLVYDGNARLLPEKVDQ